MRNLKKVLSLSLAFVMLLGMMVVGGSAATADFSDAAEIENSTAVNALYTLGVINGRDDGSFDPTGSVTRAEMAKMICVLHNGGKDPLIGSDATAVFSDTVGHWAAPYIAYATNIEVIAGLGNNTFAPNVTVTGAQAAKMLLVTLGYDPDVFGLVGSDWALNAAVIANQIDLFDGIEDITLSQPLNREDAAQMIFNALNAHIMTKTYDKVLSNGEISYTYYLNEGKTLLNDTYGAIKVEGVVISNEYADLNAAGACHDDGKTAIVVTNNDEINGALNTTAYGESTFVTSTGYDELGKAVILYVKPSQVSKTTTKATVIGGAILNENTVVTKDSKWMSLNSLKSAGLKTAMPDSYYVNGDAVAATYGVGVGVNVNGYKTQFIDNNLDGTVDYVLVDKVDLGYVTNYKTDGNGTISVATAGGTVTYNDSKLVVGFENVAKGDYVLWSEVGGRLYVEKAETLTGTLTDYNSQTGTGVDAKQYLKIDGETYVISGVTGRTVNNLTDALNYKQLAKESLFYFDACGYVTSASNPVVNVYALAVYADSDAHIDGSLMTAPRAETYFEDGTKSTPVYTYIDAAGNNVSANGYDEVFVYDGTADTELEETAAAQDVMLAPYTYVNGSLLIDNTGLITFTSTSTDVVEYEQGNVLVEVNSSYLKDNNGFNYYMTDSTVVYFVNTKPGMTIATANGVGSVMTFVGKDNIPGFKLDGASTANGNYVIKYYVNANNEIEAMAVISQGVSNLMSNYLYVIDVLTTATTTKQVQVAIDGEVKVVTVNSRANQAVAYGVNLYAIDENGNYELTTTGVSGVRYKDEIERKNTNQRTIVVNGDEYFISDDTTFVSLVGMAEPSSFEELNRGDNISIVSDSNNNLLAVYVEGAVDTTTPGSTPSFTVSSSAYTLTLKGLNVSSAYTINFYNEAGTVIETQAGSTDGDGEITFTTGSLSSYKNKNIYYVVTLDSAVSATNGGVVATGAFVGQ